MMSQRTSNDGAEAFTRPLLAAPYVIFEREQWAALRGTASMALSEGELAKLEGVNDPASLADVTEVFLPLAEAYRLTHRRCPQSWQHGGRGLRWTAACNPALRCSHCRQRCGGQRTFSQFLQAVLAQGKQHPRVDLVATDGFSLPD